MTMTMNELVAWFQNSFPGMVKDMQNSTHHFIDDNGKVHLNPFHLEGDVWTHAMMVMRQAQDRNVNWNVMLAALGHDLGKPISEYQVPERQRVRFSGHEGVSVFLMEEVLRWLLSEHRNSLSMDQKRHILELVNWHQNLFKEVVNENGRFRMSKKAIQDFGLQPVRQIDDLLDLMTCDGNGRFGDPPYTFNYKEMFGTEFSYAQEWLSQEMYTGPVDGEITLLIGPPCSGKSTWVEKNKKDRFILSRDDVMMELAPKYMNYDQAWGAVDQKKVDSELAMRFQVAKRVHSNIIVDMTNMSKKSRRRWLQVPKSWRKTAIVFMTTVDELKRRNNQRPGKRIPDEVFKRMMLNFHAPLYSEFDIIEWIFN